MSRFTGMAMIAATVGVLAHFAWTRPCAELVQTQEVMLPIVLMALLGKVMPSIFLSEGLRRIGPGRTVLLSGIGPVAPSAWATPYSARRCHSSNWPAQHSCLAGWVW